MDGPDPDTSPTAEDVFAAAQRLLAGQPEQDLTAPSDASDLNVPPASEPLQPQTPDDASEPEAPVAVELDEPAGAAADGAADPGVSPDGDGDASAAYGPRVPWPEEPPDLDERFTPEPASDHSGAAAEASAPGAVSELVSLCMAALAARRPRQPPWVAITERVTPNGTITLAHLHGEGPITVEYARYLLAVGAAIPPPPDPTNIPLTEAQRRTHDPPPALVAAIHARDGTCRSPGCRRASHRGDNDHTIRFPDGLTEPGNLAALCRRHHRLKHDGGWTLRQNADATLIWTTPAGHTYLTYPRGHSDTWQGTTSHPSEPVVGQREVA